MIKRLVVCAVALGLASCAGTGRALSYGMDLADAKVLLGAAEFQIYVHPEDDTLLVQRSLKQIAGGQDSSVEFRAAGAQFIAPLGCQTASIQLLAAGTYEVAYTCPEGTDLRTTVASQRASLRAGASIQR